MFLSPTFSIGSIAPNTKVLYRFKNLSVRDYSNNNLTGLKTGVPVFNSLGYDPTTSDTNYVKVATAVDTFLAAATTYTMEWKNVSLTTLTPPVGSTLQMLWSSQLGTYSGVFPTGILNMTNGGGGLNTAAGVIAANVNYTITYTQVGTARKLYVDGVLKASDSSGTTSDNGLGGFLGRYSNGSTPFYQWQGSIGQFRVQTTVPGLPIQN